MNTMRLTAIACVASLMVAPALAQNTKIDAGGGKGLVVVDVSNNDIANELAENLSVDVQDVIDVGSVQIPINAAAAVCNLDVNVIASSNDKGTKSCAAETTSEALNQAVQVALNNQ